MVIDAVMTEVPDPRRLSPELARKLRDVFREYARRVPGGLIEQQLMDCHSPERARRIAAGPLVLSDELRTDDRRALDDAVFELLGVGDAAERAQLVQRLHDDTARHFRAIRVVEIEKMEQRSRTASRRFSVQELAADAWDAAELPDLTPLAEWIGKRPECTSAVTIPEERPAEPSNSPMFDPNTLYFGRRPGGRGRDGTAGAQVDCASNGQAKLIVRVANVGVSGWVNVPADEAPCLATLRAVDARLHAARKRFDELAESRTSDPRLQAQIVDQLLHWFVHGRNAGGKAATAAAEADGSDEAA
jgi:hypothetical protein